MPTTSNFGWTTPADTDLVKDGAAAIRTLANGIDTSLVDLKGGTTGQILSKNSNTDLDYTWINNDQGDIIAVTAGTGLTGGGTTGAVTLTNDMATTITAAGDIVVGTGSGTYDNLPIGTTGEVLTADTTVSPYKVKWAAAGGASGPAFSVTRITSNQSLTQNTNVKLQWNSEDFDTANCFDSTTNYRFTPTTAGYYQINVIAWIDQNNATFQTAYLSLYKNGSAYKTLSGTKLENFTIGGSLVVYLNGSTDYIEVYGYSTTAAGSFRAGSGDNCFSGVWIRS